MARKRGETRKPRLKLHVRKGDEVVVIAGNNRGVRGKVLKVDRERGRVVVEGTRRVRRYVRPTQSNPQGGVIEREPWIHVSNVMLWDATANKRSRIGHKRLEDGRRVRVLKASGDTLEG